MIFGERLDKKFFGNDADFDIMFSSLSGEEIK